MFNNVSELEIGVYNQKKCMLISRNKYKEIVVNNIHLFFPSSFEYEINRLLSAMNDLDRDSLILSIQKEISCGLFIIKFNDEVIVAGSYLDLSLSWLETENEVIISDSSLEIAKKYKLPISYAAVSSYLILNLPFYPFQTCSFWKGVLKISPFHILSISENGVKEVLFNKILPVQDNVDTTIKDIREKIIRNLCAVKNKYSSYSCDVSGGVDSACIAYILNKITSNFKIFHAESNEGSNSDTKWAEYISKDIGIDLNKLHSVGVSGKRFSVKDPYINDIATDSPLLWGDTEGYVEELLNSMYDAPNHIHLIGIGGDELYTPMISAPWSIVHQEGINSIGYIIRYGVLMKRPFVSCIRDLLDNTEYEDEIRKRITDAFKYGDNDKIIRELNWSGDIKVPKWLNIKYKEKSYKWISNLMEKNCYLLDHDRSRFQALQSVIFQKSVFSQIKQVVGAEMDWYAPFLDMDVINDSLTIPSKFSIDVQKTKPILYEILKGIVPVEVFTRGVKGDYSNELFEGYRVAAKEYAGEIRDFELAKMGIIDAEILSSELSMPTALQDRIEYFVRVCVLERWLRQVKKYTNQE